MEQPRYFAPAADGAARILALLSRYTTRSMTLSELVAALDISKATCLRIVKTLEMHGLVHFDAMTKRYSLGYYCVILGARAEETLDYLSYVRPLLREAADRTGLTAVFIQRAGTDRMTYVAKEEPSGSPAGRRSAGVHVSVGNRFPITDVSYGKWVIAYADDAEGQRILADGLRQVTDRTVVDRDEYLASVAAAYRDGVLLSESEYIQGVTAVSCPVVDVASGLLGVITVLGLTDELQGDRLEEVRTVVLDIGAAAKFDGSVLQNRGTA